ncbi:MAG: 23S rRNA (guanosine(2251)-2'-O)-methyltransferase RlmB [Alphaproteobacteria bacterium]|nr:23S rRNA (guanosine(2251)-2'-O)-methyltransferase RlmB [Alphaproteobacteria bacterium]
MKKFNKPHNGENKDQLIIYGRHAVLSALKNPKRQIHKLLITSENRAEIEHTAPNLSYIVADKKEFARILGNEAVHQGFALFCSRLETYDIADLIALSEQRGQCHILILDQVTDPQNIGAIIRSCVAFDTLGLIMQDKNSPIESGAMDKAAAGTIEFLPIARVTNLNRAIENLKQAGFWIIGMDGYAQTTIDKINKSGKTAIIMGSEGKGMRRLVQENCDTSVKLPISPNVESLNVSTAAAIALYELNKK